MKNPKDVKFYIDQLKSEECHCGRVKTMARSVCYSCWLKLPRAIQMSLYSPIRGGYEEAYDEAIEFLSD